MKRRGSRFKPKGEGKGVPIWEMEGLMIQFQEGGGGEGKAWGSRFELGGGGNGKGQGSNPLAALQS